MDVQGPNLGTNALRGPKRTVNRVNLATVTPYANDHRANFDQQPALDEDSSLA